MKTLDSILQAGGRTRLKNALSNGRGQGTVLSILLVSALLNLLPCDSAQAAAQVWKNLGSDFSTAANWANAVPGAGDVAQFNSVESVQPILADTGARSIAGFLFSATTASGYDFTRSSTGSFTLTGYDTSGASGTSNSSAAAIRASNTSGTNTFEVPLLLAPASGTVSTFYQIAGGTLVVKSAISGTGSLSLAGTGATFELDGDNSGLTGGLSVAGTNMTTLIIGSSNALGGAGGAGTVAINSATILQAGGGARSIANAVNLTATATINGANDLSISGAVDLGAALTITGAGNFTLSGTVKNTGTLGYTGSGTLTLSGANSYSGTSNFNSSGTVSLTGSNSSAGQTLLRGTTVLQLASSSNGGLASGLLTWSDGTTIQAVGAARSISNAITLSGTTLTVSGSQDLTFNGVATQTSAGRITSSITGGKTLTLAGNVFLSDVATTGRTLTINGTGLTKISGVIANFNGSGSNGSLAYTGSSTLTLTNTNTYTGTTSISGGGTISVSTIGNSGASGNVGAGTTINLGASATNGTLLYTGTGETTNRIINLQAGTGGGGVLDQSGTGSLKFTADLTSSGISTKTLTLQGSTAGVAEFAGRIIDPSSTTKISVLKQGTGTWTLSGANTYSGTTTVNGGGTLLLSSTGSINSSTSVQISVGALTLQTATGLSDSGTLSLAAGTTLNLDASDGTSSEIIAALNINGNSVAAGTYTAAQLTSFEQQGDNITFESLNGETLTITPVPEPATIFGGILLVGALGWNQRRRLGGLAGLRRLACAA